MDDAKRLWFWWQSLLAEFRGVFTLGGWARTPDGQRLVAGSDDGTIKIWTATPPQPLGE